MDDEWSSRNIMLYFRTRTNIKKAAYFKVLKKVRFVKNFCFLLNRIFFQFLRTVKKT